MSHRMNALIILLCMCTLKMYDMLYMLYLRVYSFKVCDFVLLCQDYVILDEGHKIKNPSNKCSKGVQAVSAKQRLILSGTPVMNNLKVHVQSHVAIRLILDGQIIGSAVSSRVCLIQGLETL